LSLPGREWFLGAVILYGISALHTIFLWRKGFRHHNRVTYVLLLLGFALHTMAMLKRGLSLSRCPTHNLYEATAFIMWTIVAAYLALGLWGRVRFLGAFASPVLFGLGVFALMPALDRPAQSHPDFSMHWASLHATLVLLSYGAFALGAVAGVMYLTQTHSLKFDKLQAVFSLLPPIQRLEGAMGWLLSAGFGLLTIGLAAASRIKRPEGVSYLSDSKVIWSVVVWLLYLGLILLRWRFDQRGRRIALGLIGAFVFVLLTFWGTALLSPLHNPVP
jgi:ABC-type transport system involved in cytochrome c biogenesis permease subunit